jgi:hypothetical protein
MYQQFVFAAEIYRAPPHFARAAGHIRPFSRSMARYLGKIGA